MDGSYAQPLPAPASLAATRLAHLAPRPTSVAESGLTVDLLADLASRLLLRAGVLTASQLATRLGVSGGIVMEVSQFMRREARVEVRPGTASDLELSYVLTARGRQLAHDALMRDGYIGPAPVPLDQYVRLLRAQSVHERRVTRTLMESAFQGIVLADGLRDRLGMALNSRRAIVLHGPAGSGKTFVARLLTRLLEGEILIPYAILIDDVILRLFDPAVHEPILIADGASPLMLESGFDARFQCCERPFVHVGGELDLGMLDVTFRESTRELQAPLQLKANNGLLIIDDFGRQRATVEQICNRWIVPLEDRVDHFSCAGKHFAAPFDLILVFATNLGPEQLADAALLRRLGYKIAFGPISAQTYDELWRQQCAALQIPYRPELVRYALHELHGRHNVALLACHPRDLLNMVADYQRYEESGPAMDQEQLRWAWENYFLQPG